MRESPWNVADDMLTPHVSGGFMGGMYFTFRALSCAQSSPIDIVFNGGMYIHLSLDFAPVNRGRQKWDFCWQPTVHRTEYYCQ